MPTNIIQTVSDEDGSVTLHVEGDMLVDDAMLLEKIALGMRGDNFREVVIDLADLDFMDSESAPILKRVAKEHGFRIEGMEIFLQSAIDSAERTAQN